MTFPLDSTRLVDTTPIRPASSPRGGPSRPTITTSRSAPAPRSDALSIARDGITRPKSRDRPSPARAPCSVSTVFNLLRVGVKHPTSLCRHHHSSSRLSALASPRRRRLRHVGSANPLTPSRPALLPPFLSHLASHSLPFRPIRSLPTTAEQDPHLLPPCWRGHFQVRPDQPFWAVESPRGPRAPLDHLAYCSR